MLIKLTKTACNRNITFTRETLLATNNDDNSNDSSNENGDKNPTGPGINFINVLRTNFLYEHRFGSFSLVTKPKHNERKAEQSIHTKKFTHSSM
jgi:hypothetical protein